MKCTLGEEGKIANDEIEANRRKLPSINLELATVVYQSLRTAIPLVMSLNQTPNIYPSHRTGS